MKVAVVGTGDMGARIAARLIDAGHDVSVWNRTPAKLAPLIERGAAPAATPAAAAECAEVLITVLADPPALRVVSGDVARGAHDSLLVVEMSTVGPDAIADLRAALPANVELVDAPVLGSLAEVESGTLTILAGGPAPAVDRAEPLLEALGMVVRAGPQGSGAAAKLVANTALLTAVAALGEAVRLGRALGLAEDVLFAVLAATPLGAQAERRREAIAEGAYPPRFRLALARKDAELAREATDADLRLLAATSSWFETAEAAGLGERDYTAVLAAILGEGV